MSDWISVDDKLPEILTEVIIALSTKSVVVGIRWPANIWDWAETDNDDDLDAHVTHWMALPEPPAIEEVEDDEPHCRACQDTGIGTNGPDSKCYACPKKGGRDEP